jgi:putative transposase
MKINRGFTSRLKPTPQQSEAFRQHAGICRLIYNLALFQRERGVLR